MIFQQVAALLAGALAVVVAGSLSQLTHDVKPATKSNREIPSSYILHERQMPQWSRSWKRVAKAPRDTILPIRVGLRQRNLEEGEQLLYEISNPVSEKFGQRMTPEEVIDFFAPDQSVVDAVMNWLISSGITRDRISQSVNHQWIQFDAHVEEMEHILYSEFFIFNHLASDRLNIAVDQYYLPRQLRDHVDYITPGIKSFPYSGKPPQPSSSPRKRETESLERKGMKFTAAAQPQRQFNFSLLTPENCDKYVTISCIKSQYNIPTNSLAAEGNELGIFESLGDHYSKEALDIYFSKLYPYIPNGTYPIEKLIDGAVGSIEDAGLPTNVTLESNLDLMSTWPIIWPQRVALFQTDDPYYENNPKHQGFLNTFLDAIDGSYCNYSAFGETGDCKEPECLDPVYPNPNPGGYKGERQCGVYKPTNIISISYYGGEAYWPESYERRQCNEMMKLGLQGTTIVVSSGDFGVGTFPYDNQFPSGCAGPNGTIFSPSVPAACPYVLSVGATSFTFSSSNRSSSTSTKPYETALAASGGGFANYWNAPVWQQRHINDYFNRVDPGFIGYNDAGTNFSNVGNGVYKIGGRGFPDVSAIGDSFVIFARGVWGRAYGTSLSAPIWSAILTLINEHRLAAGKRTIGFINPILYAFPDVLNDITVGSNPNCHASGFYCAKGWDPVTGLGTPRFSKLLELFMSLP